MRLLISRIQCAYAWKRPRHEISHGTSAQLFFLRENTQRFAGSHQRTVMKMTACTSSHYACDSSFHCFRRLLHSSPPLLSSKNEGTLGDSPEASVETPMKASNEPLVQGGAVNHSPTVEYTTPELTRDAAKHKVGIDDPERPPWQNPLHHNNPDVKKFFRDHFDSEQEFLGAQVPAPPLGDTTPQYIQELADEVVNLTLLEMNELVNKIAQHYGFHEGMLSPDIDVDGAHRITGDEDEDAAAAAAPSKTVFDVKLVSFDDKAKIKIIKEVRAIAGLGLKEAKEMVEGAPKIVLKQIKQEQAEEIKNKLEELGAVIEMV